jgi:predicted neuraminidase
MNQHQRLCAALAIAALLLWHPAARAADAPLEAYACRQDIHANDPAYPGVHVSTLVQAPNGDLLYAFYAGSQEAADDVRTYGSRLGVASHTWTTPTVIFDEPNKPDGNAVLGTDASGNVYLLFSTIMGSGWTDATMRIIFSSDSGRTWSAPRFVREQWGWLPGTRPFRMSNGEFIVPIYSEVDWTSGWYISSDNLQTLTPYPSSDSTQWPTSLAGAIQPTTIEVTPGHLVAYLRSRDFFIWKTESFDYGRTWARPLPTTLPNPNARIALLQLDTGHWLLAYNPSQYSRSPLRLALSEDGGASWPYSLDVESETGQEFSYPYLIQTDDGYIHLGYTHRRLSMRHLVFTEAFVRTNTSIPSNASYTTKAEYAGGVLRDVAVCSYSIPDVDPPVLYLPSNPTVEATAPNGAVVTLSARAQDEVDGDVPVTLNPPSGSTFALGTTTVTATATDAAGNSASGTFSVNVRDSTAPVFRSLTASPSTLTGPNHAMVAVTVTPSVADAVDLSPSSRIVAVSSNEAQTGLWKGDIGPDWEITGPLTLNLRAERFGDERIYTIVVESRDRFGNASTKSVSVVVPRGKSH